jgi:hypothetical protein
VKDAGSVNGKGSGGEKGKRKGKGGDAVEGGDAKNADAAKEEEGDADAAADQPEKKATVKAYDVTLRGKRKRCSKHFLESFGGGLLDVAVLLGFGCLGISCACLYYTSADERNAMITGFFTSLGMGILLGPITLSAQFWVAFVHQKGMGGYRKGMKAWYREADKDGDGKTGCSELCGAIRRAANAQAGHGTSVAAGYEGGIFATAIAAAHSGKTKEKKPKAKSRWRTAKAATAVAAGGHNRVAPGASFEGVSIQQ